jgi:two-component system response regulator GlrR
VTKNKSLHGFVAPAALTVSICASDAFGDYPHSLCGALPTSTETSLSVSTGSLTTDPSCCDLLIQVVSEACLPAAIEQLRRQRADHPACAVLVVAVDLQPSHTQDLLAAGACDFLRSPVADGELAIRVRRALGLPQEGIHEPPVTGQPPAHPALRGIVGNSPAFTRVVARVPVLARYDASVLILGDTGTGKEVIAQAIHYQSARAGGPWVAVNCAAIPTELLEAELFGHVKGAYTHAHSARTGLVREAEGGTLLLDEIDSLPYGAQAKLLRFLQEKEYRPVGSNQVARADVRVIAATNRDPADLVARGSFRQDLLFRLNVITLHLPPLRERQSDIPTLALYFLRTAARQWQKAAPGLTPAAVKKLLAHDWPGNVRELKNVMERAVLMSSAVQLDAQDIDLGVKQHMQDGTVVDESFRAAKARVVENFERSFIAQLLASNAGNVTHAAQAAKKNRRAFFELMRKYKIEPGVYRERI